jgi:hypothetical protein
LRIAAHFLILDGESAPSDRPKIKQRLLSSTFAALSCSGMTMSQPGMPEMLSDLLRGPISHVCQRNGKRDKEENRVQRYAQTHCQTGEESRRARLHKRRFFHNASFLF